MQQMKPLIQRAAMEQMARDKADFELMIIRKMMAVTLKVLFDEYDFKPNKLMAVMKEITNQFELVKEKYIKIEDFYKLLEEMGIKVT